MSIGEWVSVQSVRELNQHQVAIESLELREAPEEEQEELALIYQSKGLDEKTARDLAANLMRQSTTALDTPAREELGIDPKDLGGSAWGSHHLVFPVRHRSYYPGVPVHLHQWLHRNRHQPDPQRVGLVRDRSRREYASSGGGCQPSSITCAMREMMAGASSSPGICTVPTSFLVGFSFCPREGSGRSITWMRWSWVGC